jgi:hypothetical protein
LPGTFSHCFTSSSAAEAELPDRNSDKLIRAMNKFAILKEFLVFLRERKKWWIAPIVILLLLLGGLLMFAKGSALAPFIYSFF